MMFDDNYDEGGYCENCDQSYPELAFMLFPVDEWHDRFECPGCGQLSEKVIKSDRFYALAYYLLSVADDDYAMVDYMPRFEY